VEKLKKKEGKLEDRRGRRNMDKENDRKKRETKPRE
jgi:hypothetical protein